MAQQLHTDGEIVDALFLIEAIYDERYWPKAIWRRAVMRRSGRQLGRIVRLPPGQAWGELRNRGTRLVQRLTRRRSDNTADPLKSGETEAGTRAYAAIGAYRPQFYPGPITLVASASDRHFGCDTALVWAGLAERMEIERVDGDHLTVMHDPRTCRCCRRDHRPSTCTVQAGMDRAPAATWFRSRARGHNHAVVLSHPARPRHDRIGVRGLRVPSRQPQPRSGRRDVW